jgi:hypothetical protein
MFKISLVVCFLLLTVQGNAQVKWTNADADYGPLPKGFHVFKSTGSLDGKPFLAYYAIADLKQKSFNLLRIPRIKDE